MSPGVVVGDANGMSNAQSLTRPSVDVRVRDCMHHGVLTCGPGDSLQEVAAIMANHRVHAVVITSGNGARPIGIVSDLDVLSALTRPGGAATAGDLAGDPVITVPSTLPLRQAAELMVRHRAHHVVVADPEHHTPVGVVSTLDVARVLAGP